MSSPSEVQRDVREPLVIWRFCDGKPGHENQTLGLVHALGKLLPVQAFELPAPSAWQAWMNLALGRCPLTDQLPDPDLLLGAGHGTHAAMLACRRARRGRVVVLMRPSLPLAWFDLCLVPAHDHVAPDQRVVVTHGVLNAVQPAAPDPEHPGLILIGGPSRHYDWDTDRLRSQLSVIFERDPRSWILVTSRRTPADTEQALADIERDGVTLVRWRDVAPGWLAARLPGTPAAWVTEDSVSMLYEALTAGAACGVLPVPISVSSRVSEGLRGLLADGVVSGFEQWQDGRPLHPPPHPFDEAARCARLIVERWFAN